MIKKYVILTIILFTGLITTACISEKTDTVTSTSNSVILNVGAAFAPDSSHFVFSSNRNGSGDVFKVEFTGKTIVQMTSFDNDEWTTRGCYNPDGKDLLFESNSQGTFGSWILNPTSGGTTLRFYVNNADYRFVNYSADGTKLIYSRRNNKSSYYNIYMSNTDGSSEEQVTFTNNHDLKPTMSAAGKLVFYRYIGTQTDLIMIDTTNKAYIETNITNTSTIDEYDPVVAYNSERVYFVTGDINGDGSIIAMNLDGTNADYLVQTKGHYQDIAISPNDSRLLYTYTSDGITYDIYLSDINGTLIKKMTSGSSSTIE